MRILILSTYDQKGGAAIAAFRLASALKKHTEAEVHLLVREKTSEENWVVQSRSGFLASLMNKWDEAWERLLFMQKEKDPSVRFQFSIANTGQKLRDHKLVKQADIIHLHWINQGFVSIDEIAHLQQLNKPVMWTLHDMWAFTGGEHYTESESYKNESGHSEMLSKPGPRDLSHQLWKKKKLSYQRLDFVTCSQWLCGLAKESSLLKEFPVEAIPNPIDTSFFSRKEIKKRQYSKEGKLNILFGAFNISDPRKGFQYLVDALSELPAELLEHLNLLVVGKGEAIDSFDLKLSYSLLGSIRPSNMPELYSESDLMIVPSLQDNLPNTIMEAMSCSCPVVGFKTGGIPEMIEDEVTGYLAEKASVSSFKDAIQRFLDNPNKKEMGAKARKRVEEKYAEEVVVKQYFAHYQKLLASW